MILSTNLLPSNLTRILTVFTDPFQATANEFLNIQLVKDNAFTRVCELHNTLDLLSTVRDPVNVLEQMLGGGAQNEVRGAQEYLGFLLNAEFVLFQAYRQYGLRMNPSLAHWVDACREYQAKQDSNASGVREEALKIRIAFVKGILGEQGDKLADATPREFAARGTEVEIDIDSFDEALYEQWIYDRPMRKRAGKEPAVDYSSTTTTATQSPIINQAEISTLLQKATSEALRPNIIASLLSMLESTPPLLTTPPLDNPTTTILTGLNVHNPVLTRGLLPLLILHLQPYPQRRQALLSALSFLKPNLNALETINVLITQTPVLARDETTLLIHNFLGNGINSAEGMLRRAQSRQVQLLCLFVQSLVRASVISVEEVYYEVQMLGVRFMYVKEARELWKVVCG